MKNLVAIVLLCILDALCIFTSLIMATFLRIYFDELFIYPESTNLFKYAQMPIFYILILFIFFMEGFYTKRYDFWHESKKILKSIFITLVLVLAFFALEKIAHKYSRLVIVSSFTIMSILIPIQKYLTKKILFKLQIWQKKATVYGKNAFFRKEVFSNSYLGYKESDATTAKTLFIDSEHYSSEQLQNIFDKNIKTNKEIIFIPIINEYDFSNSVIYELLNAKKNLIVLENNLLKIHNKIFKNTFDYTLAIILLPILVPIVLIISIMIKINDPKGKVFFNQKRMGKDKKIFICHKFRTMYHEQDEILNTYLQKNPDEIENYKKYHKYKNDPRITSIGKILRKTSLDELPQILNIFKNEMSFIGPRPYMTTEKNIMGKKIDLVLSVKPGITGLWQVSGRNNVDFQSRINLDVWYIRNWHFFMDIAIAIKTIKTVLFRNGAS